MRHHVAGLLSKTLALTAALGVLPSCKRAAPTEQTPTSSAEEAPIAPPKTLPRPGPHAWRAALEHVAGNEPPFPPAPKVKALGLACATTLASDYLEKKFGSARDALVKARDAGAADREAEWARKYRPWFLRRASLVAAFEDGCEFDGELLPKGSCAELKPGWTEKEASRPFKCAAPFAWSVETKSGAIAKILCEQLEGGPSVIISVPSSARGNTGTGSISEALGVPSAPTTADWIREAPSKPAIINLTRWSAIEWLPASEGFVNRNVRELVDAGLTSEAAHALFGRGELWDVTVVAGGWDLVERGVPQPREPIATSEPPASMSEEPKLGCDPEEGRWNVAACEFVELPRAQADDLGHGLPMTLARGTTRVGTSRAAPGVGAAYRRPVARRPGGVVFHEKVVAMGGFEDIECRLEDASYESGGFRSLRREMAIHAGVAEDALGNWTLHCRGTKSTSTQKILVHVPTHLISATAKPSSELGQRGEVWVEGYRADPARLFSGRLAVLREQGLIDLARGAKLRIRGYTHVWRESRYEWHVTFDPECSDEGLDCSWWDGLTPSIELVSTEDETDEAKSKGRGDKDAKRSDDAENGICPVSTYQYP